MAAFLTEIRKMMYVCGDCVHPHPESASLVESVTLQQVVQLAVKGMECARQRSIGTEAELALTVEDILFLLRRDKVKLQRLLYQIDFRTRARRTSSGRSERGDEAPEKEGGGEGEGGGGRGGSTVDSQFLNDIFGGDFHSTAVEAADLQQERMEHHDSRTRGMDSDEYLTYVECRQVSFVKNMARFRKWLDLESVIGHKPASDVMEVLANLAYDTVRELVELSLLVKQDTERSHQNIISSQHLIFPSSHPPPTNPSCPHHSLPPSPHRRPEQPSSPSRRVSQETSSDTAGSSRTPRGRKGKRSTTSDGTSRPHDHTSQESGTGQDPGQNELGTEKSGCGIQPSHVREALRRLSVPSGPLLPLATHHCRPSYSQRTLCL